MRRTVVLVGVLFWISNLVTLVGSAISGAIPADAAALIRATPHATALTTGTLIAQVNDAAIIGYAVLLYPVMKRYGGSAALGYVAFKVVEGVLLLVGAAALLAATAVSQKYTGAAVDTSFRATANLALQLQFWAGRLAALAYLVATPMLIAVCYRSRLVPRAISVLGFAGVAMLAAGLALGVGDPTRGFQAAQVLVIPIIMWELAFATWLIVKGVRVSRPGRADRPAVSAGNAVTDGRATRVAAAT